MKGIYLPIHYYITFVMFINLSIYLHLFEYSSSESTRCIGNSGCNWQFNLILRDMRTFNQCLRQWYISYFLQHPSTSLKIFAIPKKAVFGACSTFISMPDAVIYFSKSAVNAPNEDTTAGITLTFFFSFIVVILCLNFFICRLSYSSFVHLTFYLNLHLGFINNNNT